MHLMEVVATQEQKERWLRPLASGATRSCFCMTEAAPVPVRIRRDADHGVEDGNHYVISGEKWFITGAAGPRSPSSWRKVRMVTRPCSCPTWTNRGLKSSAPWTAWTAPSPAGTRWFGSTTCRVPASDILGEPGKGFRYAQVRLAPAPGDALHALARHRRRAHDIATAYARSGRCLARSW